MRVPHAPRCAAAAAAFATLTLLATPAPQAAPAPTGSSRHPAGDWRTHAERSGYRTTPSYDETMAYCRRLVAASPWARLTTYGSSGQGRDLPLLIVSKDGAFTPAAALATGKPIVLIQNGIHSGEIEGKDATLELLRDLLVRHTHDRLLDHVVLLVLPIFSVDAHERSGRWNRINQNGPTEMGWRTTPLGLNLNRDYLKVESPEMRALIGNVYTQWWPHLLVDNHTTDGADYRHDVTYGFNHGPGVPRAIDHWFAEAFEGRVVPRLAAMGHLPAPYINFRDGNHPESGIEFGSSTPRFSTGYAPIQGRAGLLVETHMLKSYRTRVKATYDLMLALLEELDAHPGALTGAVANAEREILDRARATDPARREVVLDADFDRSAPPAKFAYKGVVTRWETSDIVGTRVPRYTSAAWDTTIPLFRDLAPTVVVRQPAGYLVPREWTIVRDHLDVHGVRYRALTKAWADTVEVAKVVAFEVEALANAHRATKVTRDSLVRRWRRFRPGDLWVPLDQRSALVAMHLLECRAPDGLTYWNAFDTVLERKEYGEDYVIEPMARRMMASNASLAREFHARLAADTAFAHSPQTRTLFFYDRTPWADPEQNLLPVSRARRAPPESVLEP
jgi:zinc carboxypeptidase